MGRIDVLVCYDVDTTSKAGRNRLRRVATICVAHGQRVQFSVFECSLTRMELEAFEAKLVDIINVKEDSLRIYSLYGGRDKSLRAHGEDRYRDFDAPLVL